MKYIKLSVIISSLLLAVTSAWAQAPASLPVIQSIDTTRNYAAASVVRGGRGIWSNSMDWDYPERLTQVEATGSSAEEVLQKLFTTKLKYRLTNPGDTVEGWVWLYDASGTQVFSGHARYSGSDGKSTAQYGIWLQQISLLDGVQDAEILVMDEDGRTANRRNVDVREGHILFEPWIAGAPNGILVVRFKDGSLATYRLNNPAMVEPGASNTGGESFKIDGHYTFVGTAGKDVIVEIVEPWYKPSVYIEVAAGQVVSFNVSGVVQSDGATRFERPTAVREMLPNGSLSEPIRLDWSDKTLLPAIRFSNPGKYRLQFDWVEFGKASTLYTGPTDGGGKG
jgi:hypothetical protein